MANCSGCGTPLPEGKKFCPECGQPVARGASSAQQTLQQLAQEEGTRPPGSPSVATEGKGLDLKDSILFSKGDINIQVQQRSGPLDASEVPRIYLLSGPEKGKAYPLVKKVSRIGRDGASEIPITWDNEVSRRHAEITRAENNVCVLKDVGSREGTFVGDDPVKSIELKVGDIIRMGQTVLGFETTGAGNTTQIHPGKITLRVQKGENLGKAFTFELSPGSQWTIGRDPQCAIYTGSKDRTISHKHARVVVGPAGEAMLVDEGGVNGSIVNGRKLGKGESVPLSPQDIIAVGATKIVVELE